MVVGVTHFSIKFFVLINPILIIEVVKTALFARVDDGDNKTIKCA